MTITLGKRHLVAAAVLVAAVSAGFYVGRATEDGATSQAGAVQTATTTSTPTTAPTTTLTAGASTTEGQPYLSPEMARQTDAGACDALKQDELQGASGRNTGAVIRTFATQTEAAARGQQEGTPSVTIASDAEAMLQTLVSNGYTNMYPTLAVGSDCKALGVTIDAQSTP